MERQKRKIDNFLISLRVGFFLAVRQVRRSSKATNFLIIFIMTLTFLNLVVVRGILVGLIEGSIRVYREHSIGEIFISRLPKKNFIENSPLIIETVRNMPWVRAYSPRYLQGGTVEAGFKERIRLTDSPNSVSGIIAGINPELENNTSSLGSKVVEGEYLDYDDTEYVLLGSSMLKKYVPIESASFSFLEDVEPGTRVRITIGQNMREFTVKGIIQTKADEVDFRAYILDSTLRSMAGITDYSMSEMAVRLKDDTDPVLVRDALLRSGVGEMARVQTGEEALPKFVIDIKNTFAILGDVVGSIGLVVASITIFIVIFVNAITRKKFIGILKGIGVSSQAIEIAYVFQSLFYAIVGIGAGLIILYGFLVPYIAANPIRFPFSDGILVAEIDATLFRVLLLMIATVVAGYIPARMVVKKNTLDSILGR